MVLTEHEFSAPLDHSSPSGATITVFAREVAAPNGADRPMLVFFQGGPGSGAPRPSGPPSGWLERALSEYRVLMLDQRGTGRSTPVATLPGKTASEQAGYLKHFRADSIVRDAEVVRRELGIDRWSVLGQSFGGFCVMSYLSLFPGSLREALLTGGLAPIGRHTDEVYRKTYARTLERNRRFYERYPDDRKRVRGIVELLDGEEVRLPSGDRLTSRRFRQMGQMLGMSDGAQRLHYLLELPMDGPAFLRDVDAASPFARNPLYAIIHEACYADGCATEWSAERGRPEIYDEQSELFTGEHVFPWMFEDIGALAGLRDAAEMLAAYQWPRLYAPEVLAENTVPVAAAVYFEDMYVDPEFSVETAGRIKGARPWVTNEFEHDGLRLHGEKVMDRLLAMARGEAWPAFSALLPALAARTLKWAMAASLKRLEPSLRVAVTCQWPMSRRWLGAGSRKKIIPARPATCRPMEGPVIRPLPKRGSRAKVYFTPRVP